MVSSKHILPLIVLAQFCCTSLWFAGNAVMTDLAETFNLETEALGHLTSAVQFGFISGTLLFAFLSLADRFSPSKVFFTAALFGAVFNLGLVLKTNSFGSLLLLRYLAGFSLAGIYPVGMKIAADYFQKGLGTSLGYLVGALVLGTAFPHLLKTFASESIPWKLVLYATSGLSLMGGSLVFFLVPDGPFRKRKLKKDFSAFLKVFRIPDFRAAAFGYFGHMWELYAFWAFIPVILHFFQEFHSLEAFNVPLLSFLIIGCGSVSCVLGGYISENFGTKRTAGTALFLSGCCCLLSPLIFLSGSKPLLVIFLLFWGLTVVADSPLFSTLVANNAPAETKGTALTIVNSIGFAITIFSIQLLTFLISEVSPFYMYLFLAIGPIFGLAALFKKRVLLSSEK